MKDDSFFAGPIISHDGVFHDAWITIFLIVHFLSGFCLYYLAYLVFRDKNKAALAAIIVHLLYEIKDTAAFYEAPWAVKVNEFSYNTVFKDYLGIHTRDSDPRHNYPMNSVLDQLVSMLGTYLAYHHVHPYDTRTNVTLLVLWLGSQIIFNLFKYNGRTKNTK